MTTKQPEIAPLAAGLSCRCPRCGKGALYAAATSLDVLPRCAACGLDYKFIDSGDGPAVFAILILGLLILGAALIVEFRFSPPWWVHAILWVPATLIVAFGLLRPMKATLIALQYKHKAAEGRLDQG